MHGAVILAAGGHACVVYDAAVAAGMEIAGFVDAALPAGTTVVPGATVLGDEAWLGHAVQASLTCLNGLGANPDVSRRRELFLRWRERGAVFPPIVHPSAVIGRAGAIGAGTQVMAGVVLQPRVTLGQNVVVNTRASVDHDVRIGDHAFVAPGVIICGGVSIGSDAFIGAGAVLTPGVDIGAGAVIGAGAIVRHAVAAGARMYGETGPTRHDRTDRV